jgi:hypothetical protein
VRSAHAPKQSMQVTTTSPIAQPASHTPRKPALKNRKNPVLRSCAPKSVRAMLTVDCGAMREPFFAR